MRNSDDAMDAARTARYNSKAAEILSDWRCRTPKRKASLVHRMPRTRREVSVMREIATRMAPSLPRGLQDNTLNEERSVGVTAWNSMNRRRATKPITHTPKPPLPRERGFLIF